MTHRRLLFFAALIPALLATGVATTADFTLHDDPPSPESTQATLLPVLPTLDAHGCPGPGCGWVVTDSQGTITCVKLNLSVSPRAVVDEWSPTALRGGGFACSNPPASAIQQ